MGTDINAAKVNFTKRNFKISVNCERDAAYLGVIAAVQRARLYSPDISSKCKYHIREFWIEQLLDLSQKYKDPTTEEQFIEDIVALKSRMNSHFPNCFKNKNCGCDGEFRIAHAQKSLSTFLKHLWCRGYITPTPPVCPIDRVILTASGSGDSWTKVNTIEQYKHHLSLIKETIIREGYTEPAEWEVIEWNK